MSNLIPGNHKHLTLSDRQFIEQSLNEQRSFREIARYLCKDPSTISREVWKHRIVNSWNRGSFNNPYNFCVHRYHCKKQTPVGNSSSAILSAAPATDAITSVPNSKGSTAPGSKKPRSSVMDVINHGINVPSIQSTITMPKPPRGIMRSSSLRPVPG